MAYSETKLKSSGINILTAISIKITVFWDVMPCSLADMEMPSCYKMEGGIRLLRDVGTYETDYTAAYSRRPSSLFNEVCREQLYSTYDNVHRKHCFLFM
jgi:hypothetical protein